VSETSSRVDAALRWIPRAAGLAALGAGTLLAPPARTLAGEHPLTVLVYRIAQAIPLGAPDDRSHAASAIVAALIAWLAARVVAVAGRPGAATCAGAIAAGLAAGAGPLCGASAGTAAITALAVVVTCALGDRVARGERAPFGIPAAFAAGVTLASGGVGAAGAPLALLVLLWIRLRRGARWALATPAAFAIGFAAIAGAFVVHYAVGLHDLGDGIRLYGRHLAGAPFHAPWAARSGDLVDRLADELGPLALAAAAAGLVVLVADARTRWLGVALVLAAGSAASQTITDPAPASTGSIDPTLATVAAIAAGAAIARLARTIARPVGQIAIGAALAAIVAAPAALATWDRYDSARGSHSSMRLPSGSMRWANRPFASSTTLSSTVAPAARACASIASRSSTTKFSMNGFSLGAKYVVSALNGDHTVPAPAFASRCSFHSKNAPPQLWTGMPSTRSYHADSSLGFVALKNTPPMPLTRCMRRTVPEPAVPS
jgi:hypothetical protein